MMREFMKKLLNNSWMDKLKKGAQEPKNKTFRRSHVPFRLNFFFHHIYIIRRIDCTIRLSTNR